MDAGTRPQALGGGALLLAAVIAAVIGWDVYRAQSDPPSDEPAITQTTPAVQPAATVQGTIGVEQAPRP